MMKPLKGVYVGAPGSGRLAVLETCRAVLEHGAEVAPRGRPTKELAAVVLEVNPRDTLPDGISRERLLPAIGAAEALQNIAGIGCPGLMSRISSFFPSPTSRWAEGVPTYGERMQRQLHQSWAAIVADRDTREAVVAIWRDGDIVGGQAHNLCTCTLHFMRRDNVLDLFVHMRSNDAWYGLCYDLFQFAQVQVTMAGCLGVQPGRYVHYVDSMHLYDRHWAPASRLVDPTPGFDSPLTAAQGVGLGGMTWAEASLRAWDILHGRLPDTPSASERWFHDTLAPYAPDGS